jgi:acetolactate synthase I/II/III large subunit
VSPSLRWIYEKKGRQPHSAFGRLWKIEREKEGGEEGFINVMTGAESLIRTLIVSGVEVCFANPGTTELELVIALDRIESMRCVLGMAETVVTGCADGYARMAEKPAITLLHCGPGFANGIANVHNARRAHTPMVNIVGDQAMSHRPFDPPLTADTEGLARSVSHWVRTSSFASQVASDAAAAVQAAASPPGQIATLIVPADVAWGDASGAALPLPVTPRPQAAQEVVRRVANILRSAEPTMMLLNGQALCEAGLAAAYRIAHTTGAKLRGPTHVPRMARGRGRVPVDRVPYVVDAAIPLFAEFKHVILVGAKPPVGFFAYPGKPSLMTPEGCTTHLLARPEQDAVAALQWLADEIGAPRTVPIKEEGPKPRIANGPFDSEAFGMTLAALLPENAIVCDDAITSGRSIFPATFNAPPHDWIQSTGGAIGHGFPCATGAAVACPNRKVVCLQADGAGMYTLQALWTQAREKLEVVNVVFANRVYKILYGELRATGAAPGRASDTFFDLSRPDLDWVGLARGMGVEAVRVETLETFADTFRAAFSGRGPFLIEFRI